MGYVFIKKENNDVKNLKEFSTKITLFHNLLAKKKQKIHKKINLQDPMQKQSIAL